jgi:hypothetical protein
MVFNIQDSIKMGIEEIVASVSGTLKSLKWALSAAGNLLVDIFGYFPATHCVFGDDYIVHLDGLDIGIFTQ